MFRGGGRGEVGVGGGGEQERSGIREGGGHNAECGGEDKGALLKTVVHRQVLGIIGVSTERSINLHWGKTHPEKSGRECRVTEARINR